MPAFIRHSSDQILSVITWNLRRVYRNIKKETSIYKLNEVVIREREEFSWWSHIKVIVKHFVFLDVAKE